MIYYYSQRSYCVVNFFANKVLIEFPFHIRFGGQSLRGPELVNLRKVYKRKSARS